MSIFFPIYVLIALIFKIKIHELDLTINQLEVFPIQTSYMVSSLSDCIRSSDSNNIFLFRKRNVIFANITPNILNWNPSLLPQNEILCFFLFIIFFFWWNRDQSRIVLYFAYSSKEQIYLFEKVVNSLYETAHMNNFFKVERHWNNYYQIRRFWPLTRYVVLKGDLAFFLRAGFSETVTRNL